MTAQPGDAEQAGGLTAIKTAIRDLGDMACIGCRMNTCPACGLAADITTQVHVLLRAAGPADDQRLAAAFRAACDEVGVPYDVAGLIRHHRGNAALAATFDALSTARAAGPADDTAERALDLIGAKTVQRAWDRSPLLQSVKAEVAAHRRLELLRAADDTAHPADSFNRTEPIDEGER